LQKAGYQTALIGKWHLKTLPSGFDWSQINQLNGWKSVIAAGLSY
jgi:arylsulfatase A-like enzyme